MDQHKRMLGAEQKCPRVKLEPATMEAVGMVALRTGRPRKSIVEYVLACFVTQCYPELVAADSPLWGMAQCPNLLRKGPDNELLTRIGQPEAPPADQDEAEFIYRSRGTK